jgi:hypothetical protein
MTQTCSRQAVSLPASSTLLVEDPAALAAIHRPGVNLCVWRRPVSPRLLRFIDTVVLPRNVKRVLTCDSAASLIEELLQDIPGGDERDWFEEDIRGLVKLYAALLGAERVTLKLESFGGALCERFHVDWVKLRLICCYAGPGTEWLDSRHVDRSRLGPQPGDPADEYSGLLREGAVIRRLDRFAVGLMKGQLWPGNQENALVHRSPHVEDASLRRVLFKIDPAE